MMPPYQPPWLGYITETLRPMFGSSTRAACPPPPPRASPLLTTLILGADVDWASEQVWVTFARKTEPKS